MAARAGKSWDKHFLETSERTIDTTAYKFGTAMMKRQREGLRRLLADSDGKKAFGGFLESRSTGLSFWSVLRVG